MLAVIESNHRHKEYLVHRFFRRSCIAIGLAGIPMSCGDTTGPTELQELYELFSADGNPVPVMAFRTISNQAGDCVYDLLGGSATFSEAGQYGLNFSYMVRCTGAPEGVSHDQTNGTYTRSGSRLTLTPQVLGTFTVLSAELQTNRLTVRTRTNAGEEHSFRFTERTF